MIYKATKWSNKLLNHEKATTTKIKIISKFCKTTY